MAGSSSGPSKVMIIRHGEKLGDPESDDSGGKHLSLQGSARAAALPSLFLPSWWQPPTTPPSPTPPPAGPILECKLVASSGTFAASYEAKTGPSVEPRFTQAAIVVATAESNNSNRPVETATPTATALGLSINPYGSYSNSSKDIDKLANDVLTKSDYAGKVILICWHHGTIDTLATALKGTGAVKWVGTVFDRVWLLDYSQGASPPIQQFGQELLFTDETNVPATPW